jgi:hypothetical protein
MIRSIRRVLPLLAAVISVVSVTAAPAMAAKQTNHTVTGVSTVITPSAAGTQFLTNHHITVSALGAATISNGSLTLPIAGGVVKTPSLDGTIVHKGGVKFTSGKRSVSLRDIVAHRIGKVTFVTGRADGRLMIIARVTGAKVSITGKTATATGELKLSAGVAQRLNHVFGKHVVSAGADLGSAVSTITVA